MRQRFPATARRGGHVVQGLKDRRSAELALFRTRDKQNASVGNPWPEPITGSISSKAQAASLGLAEGAVVSSGNWVRWVQWELQRLGYNLGDCGVDGVCGAKTVLAIQTFQMEAGLTVDGLCGPKTMEALKAAKQRPVLTITEEPDYKARVAAKAKIIYPLCVGKRHGGTVSKLVTSLDALKKYDALSCNRMASIVLQEAGLLPVGCIVAHTPKRDGKKCIKDAVTGLENLKHCKALWVNKPYHKLPEELRAPGIVYVYNSNEAISGKDGHIFSCNKSKGYRYKDKSDYDRTSGYVKESNILVCLVPDK